MSDYVLKYAYIIPKLPKNVIWHQDQLCSTGADG